MNSWINNIYFFIGGAAVLISVVGLWLTLVMPSIDRWSKRFFLIYFIVLLMCCASGLMETIVLYYSLTSVELRVMLYMESLLISIPLVMQTVYLLHYSGENIRGSKLLYIVLGLWTVYFALLTSTLFINDFVYVTPDVEYERGAWYLLLLLPVVLIMLANLAGTIRRRNRLSRKAFTSFLIAILPMSVALIVQMFIDIFPIIDFCLVLSSLSMYGIILSDQFEQDLRQQREIANQRASIAVLQMRPHFIYNTMTSIYYLCSQDPKLAQKVVMDFTTYLRKNFTAVASSTPIPFTSELEHTQAYLSVEQAQYEDILFVDYDTPHTWFRVPPLTLQPIVENAVKHGMDPETGPLHIFIRTRKTDHGSEIIVMDNGRGFNPDDNSEPHVAIKNIRQRLEIMCGGRLTITSGDDGGTKVTVAIPDSQSQ